VAFVGVELSVPLQAVTERMVPAVIRAAILEFGDFMVMLPSTKHSYNPSDRDGSNVTVAGYRILAHFWKGYRVDCGPFVQKWDPPTV
jgi:hypothetical protein